MRLSCTCRLRVSLWCNSSLHTAHASHNVPLPSVSVSVCNDCQCQEPSTFHLVMRSVLLTRIQPNTTTLLSVRVRIELYVLAASAAWTTRPLFASSCEQVASPSMPLGSRTMTTLSIVQMTCLSFDIVTIYLIRNANNVVLLQRVSLILSNCPHCLEHHYWARLGDGFICLACPVIGLSKNLVCSCPTQLQVCVLYAVDVPHRYRNISWAYSRKVQAAAIFRTHNMLGQTDTITSTLGVMSSCSSVASSRHRTMSELMPSLSFPLADSHGGHG